MRRRVVISFLFIGTLAVLAPMFAQEGHPLTGTWHGDWGPTPTHRNQVTIVMNWNGKNVTGIINPGPDVIPMKVVTLDSTKWTVHIEADAKDSPATCCYIGSFATKSSLDAGLLHRDKDIDVRPMHDFFGIIDTICLIPANRPEVLDEWRQVGGRQVGMKTHMALETGRVQASAWLVIPCGFL